MRRIVFLLALMASHLCAQEPKSPTDRINQFRVTQAYDCRNVSCKKLRSCAEACYKLVQCGQRRRDGDNDGIPCENLCSRRCK